MKIMRYSPDQKALLPSSSSEKWTPADIKGLVRAGWGNLYGLAASANGRNDLRSRAIMRDYQYFNLQLVAGDSRLKKPEPYQQALTEPYPLLEEQLSSSLDIAPLITGLERLKTAIEFRDDSFSPYLSPENKLRAHQRAEIGTLQEYIDVLTRSTDPFPFPVGSFPWEEQLKLLKIREIKITETVGSPESHPVKILNFNEAEAERRLNEMKLLKSSAIEETIAEAKGSNRWIKAINIAAPIAVAAGIIYLLPETREVVTYWAGQGQALAREVVFSGYFPKP